LISSARSSAAPLVVALVLAGCAGAPQLPAAPPVELTAVPFFPQTDFQCGPAALATVLSHAGAAVDADDLVDDVYVAGLKGSLQAELLGATRRHGFIPFVLAPEPAALTREVAAGRPVLVLQNLGLPRAPVWHYAVVVGVADDAVILRSGTQRRRVERGPRFLRSWQRASSWAFVAVAPGTLPASADAASYVRALAGAEPLLAAGAAERGYAAALERWPADELVLFGAAAARHAAGDLGEATALYRRLLEAAPTHAAARNNLANALAARGCLAEALVEARRALADGAGQPELDAAIRDTVTELERAVAAGSDLSCDGSSR
jgi:hypothetical protein